MRKLALSALVAFVAWPVLAQEAVPADPGAMAPPPAPVLRQHQRVEVEDPENPGLWRPCTVDTVFQGAYAVNCNYEVSVVRDTKVRGLGGQPAAQTAAQPVSGPPFKRNDIVLVSPMGLPDDWRLCIVLANYVQSQNNYEVRCDRGPARVLPQWVRVDDEAPQ